MNKDELLEKYYNGKTTLKEEQWLKEQHWIEDEFNIESELFADLIKQRDSLETNGAVKTRRLMPYVISTLAAACMALLIWINVGNQKVKSSGINSELLADASFSGAITDEEHALEQTKLALIFLNKKLKEGTKEIRHIKKINESINQIKQK